LRGDAGPARRVGTAGRPWFESGQVQADVISEDMHFCRKLRAKDIPIYCDMRHTMGHLNVGEVWPIRNEDGTWKTRVIFGNQALDIPRQPRNSGWTTPPGRSSIRTAAKCQ